MSFFRSSSDLAPPPAACWYSLRSALYCSAGVADFSWPLLPTADTDRASTRTRIPPTVRLMEASSSCEKNLVRCTFLWADAGMLCQPPTPARFLIRRLEIDRHEQVPGQAQ